LGHAGGTQGMSLAQESAAGIDRFLPFYFNISISDRSNHRGRALPMTKVSGYMVFPGSPKKLTTIAPDV